MSISEDALTLMTVVLAGVFAVAGVAKLLDREGIEGRPRSRSASRAGSPDRLGSGSRLSRSRSAALLLPAATRWWAGVAALALLLAFTTAIAIAMARGKAPDCHCFGQLHSAPASWKTLARNGVLAALAASRSSAVVTIAGERDRLGR